MLLDRVPLVTEVGATSLASCRGLGRAEMYL